MPRSAETFVPQGYGDVRIALGRGGDRGTGLGGSQRLGFVISGSFGLTDRLMMTVPGALAFSFGSDQDLRVFPWGGLSRFGFELSLANGAKASVELQVASGLDLRLNLGGEHFVVTGVRTWSNGRWGNGPAHPLTTWLGAVQLGYTTTISNLLTVSVGGLLDTTWLGDRKWVLLGEGAEPRMSLGSVLSVGGRSYPLLQLHISDTFSVDGYATLDFDGDEFTATYLGGVTITR